MGKRKSSRKPQTKVKVELDKAFDCLFCNHTGSVTCKLDNKLKVGELSCKVCGQNFQATLNNLSHPIDLYSEWIDAAEEAQRRATARSGGPSGANPSLASRRTQSQGQSAGGRGVGGSRNDDQEEEDDDVDEDDDMTMSRRRTLMDDDDEDLPEA